VSQWVVYSLALPCCFLVVNTRVRFELNRLQTAKQSSINEDDKRHIGDKIDVSLYRRKDENLCVDIRQFFIPKDVAKGICILVPTK
jgi:hypothetical protein